MNVSYRCIFVVITSVLITHTTVPMSALKRAPIKARAITPMSKNRTPLRRGRSEKWGRPQTPQFPTPQMPQSPAPQTPQSFSAPKEIPITQTQISTNQRQNAGWYAWLAGFFRKTEPTAEYTHVYKRVRPVYSNTEYTLPELIEAPLAAEYRILGLDRTASWPDILAQYDKLLFENDSRFATSQQLREMRAKNQATSKELTEAFEAIKAQHVEGIR